MIYDGHTHLCLYVRYEHNNPSRIEKMKHMINESDGIDTYQTTFATVMLALELRKTYSTVFELTPCHSILFLEFILQYIWAARSIAILTLEHVFFCCEFVYNVCLPS